MSVSIRSTPLSLTHSSQRDFIKSSFFYKRTLPTKSKCIVLARRQVAACVAQVLRELPQADKLHDDELSRRDLQLDDMGYFIIFLDRENSNIVVDHYKNTINEHGACKSQEKLTQNC